MTDFRVSLHHAQKNQKAGEFIICIIYTRTVVPIFVVAIATLQMLVSAAAHIRIGLGQGLRFTQNCTTGQ